MKLAGSRVELAAGGGWLAWEGVHAVCWLQDVAGENRQDAKRCIVSS